MKGNMLIFASLSLLLCWMQPVDSMTIRFNFTLRDANQDIPLSMVDDAVDDMYLGCNEAMMNLVKSKYFEEEKASFRDAWNEAERCAENKIIETGDEALTNDHMQAICAYTSDKLYQKFNEAVRTQGSSYGSSFQFHSLHFLLTSAIQILNNNSHCHTTYRRTNSSFTGNVNQMMRFGTFASSSYITNLTDFGNKTCFKITTCSGAFLKDYSFYEGETEVLIPPYEVFKITQNDQGEIQGLDDCEVVYVLESAGDKSKLNCRVVQSSGSPTSGKTFLPIFNLLILLSQLN